MAPESDTKRYSSEEATPDASTREDDDPEAVERRRKARQDILERGRMMEERRKSKKEAANKPKSFDDLVDKDGALKEEETSGRTTAAEPQAEESGLRHRHTESQPAALGSAFANPFADGTGVSSPATLHEDPPYRSSTPTPPASTASPPVPPKPAAYQPQRLLIDTEEASNHPSEQLLDLTPTTSTSSAWNSDLAELNHDHQSTPSNYWSVNEWAQNSAPAAPHSPPRSEHAIIEEEPEINGVDSHSHNEDLLSHTSSEDLDVLSDDGVGVSTPGSWTEVGSLVSEDN